MIKKSLIYASNVLILAMVHLKELGFLNITVRVSKVEVEHSVGGYTAIEWFLFPRFNNNTYRNTENKVNN